MNLKQKLKIIDEVYENNQFDPCIEHKKYSLEIMERMENKLFHHPMTYIGLFSTGLILGQLVYTLYVMFI